MTDIEHYEHVFNRDITYEYRLWEGFIELH